MPFRTTDELLTRNELIEGVVEALGVESDDAPDGYAQALAARAAPAVVVPDSDDAPDGYAQALAQRAKGE